MLEHIALVWCAKIIKRPELLLVAEGEKRQNTLSG